MADMNINSSYNKTTNYSIGDNVSNNNIGIKSNYNRTAPKVITTAVSNYQHRMGVVETMDLSIHEVDQNTNQNNNTQ